MRLHLNLGAYPFLIVLLLWGQHGLCLEGEEPRDPYVSDWEDNRSLATKVDFVTGLLIVAAYKISEQFDEKFQRILSSMDPFGEVKPRLTHVIQQTVALTTQYNDIAEALECETTREEARSQFERLWAEAEAVKRNANEARALISLASMNATVGAEVLYQEVEDTLTGRTDQARKQIDEIRFTLRLMTTEWPEWKGAKVLTGADRAAVEGLVELMNRTCKEGELELVKMAAAGQFPHGNLANVENIWITEYIAFHALQLRRVITSTMVRRVFHVPDLKLGLPHMLMYESGINFKRGQLNNAWIDLALAKGGAKINYKKYYGGEWLPKDSGPPFEGCECYTRLLGKGIRFWNKLNCILICDSD